LRHSLTGPSLPDMSLGFFRALVRAPGSVGAIWPSSPFLAEAIVRASAIQNAACVIELGPGTGAFTGHILSSLHKDARFAAIEKCPILTRSVSKKFPHALIIEGCATELGSHLEKENMPKPNAIVSGLPWAAFSESLQNGILKEVEAALSSDGVFSTFAYYGPHHLPAGRRFRKTLGQTFGDIRRMPVVVRNFPPAFVYTCRR
jgi:phospholipid N-methyltransferase